MKTFTAHPTNLPEDNETFITRPVKLAEENIQFILNSQSKSLAIVKQAILRAQKQIVNKSCEHNLHWSHSHSNWGVSP